MPEKKQAGREGEEKLIRHLGGQARRGIHCGLVNQTPENSAGEPEKFHLRGTLLCRKQISIKLSASLPALATRSLDGGGPNEF
jgi:hypothetical protein